MNAATPIYAATIRATGIIPDGFPDAAHVPAGSVVLDMPSVTDGVTLVGLPMAPISVLSQRVTSLRSKRGPAAKQLPSGKQ